MKTIIRDVDIDDIHIIQRIALETWPHAYGKILSQEQLAHMLDALYSDTALQKLIESKQQHFLLLIKHDTPVAFAAYGLWDAQVYKLHKLYILPGQQGKGYGRALIEEVISRARNNLVTRLLLNVNRHNSAVDFYKKLGFHVVKKEDIPLGAFWMNDYVMEMEIQP